ncbi:MAG: cyclopropane-fatty-acyl-phospholipid synthase family protein [Saprospiraceae bacterium]
MNSQSVKNYYDHNTRLFLKLGQNANSQNIHSALWAEGVEDLSVAINYANELVFKELVQLQAKKQDQPLSVLDLGCGVGSSLFYLAHKAAPTTQFHGITISAKQAVIAQQHLQQMQSSNCTIVEGDFQQLGDHIPSLDLAFAIEAFIHAPDAQVFFQQISQKLKPGGLLIIIDDVLEELLTTANTRTQKKIKTVLSNFKDNWMAGSLLTIKQLEKHASQHQMRLSKNKNLTPYLPLNRPRDIFIRTLLKFTKPFFRNNPYHRSLIGGDARQIALLNHYICYRCLVFEKL